MSNKLILSIIGLLFLVALCMVYSNHFNNGFYFDDSHTITNNEAIQSLDNITSFFLDASTFSSLPANRAYRPLVTTLNAVSYKLGGGLDPVYFHIHMFFWYVVQLVLMFFFILNLLKITSDQPFNQYLALGATVFYGFHTSNAETINYLISISDSFSTMCIVASLLAWQHRFSRKYHLYLIPMVMALYTKQTGLMVVPILMLYILLFEEKALWPLNYTDLLIKVKITLKKSFPAIFVGVNILLLNQLLFTPETTVSLNTGASKFQYFYTQFFIISHYLRNFILPNALSADPDFILIPSVLDVRVFYGLALIGILLYFSFWSVKRRETAPIAFGILWFFIALLPTSSFVPLFQIANDHRTFFPYIGLVISLATYLRYLFMKYNFLQNRYKAVILAGFFALISLHSYGVYQRNEVWNTSESLWHDVSVKSPGNGRGLMNYGLTLMAKGDYKSTEEYFKRALVLTPYYSYLYINMAILKNSMAKYNEVEPNFKRALELDPYNPECYYYYASWLNANIRQKEAFQLLKKGLSISSNHAYMRTLYQQLSVIEGIDNYVPQKELQSGLNIEDTYLELSLTLYQKGDFEGCIKVCEKIIEINPNSALAYNNMCSAYNNINKPDEAMTACTRALQIDPNFTRARNNLNIAINKKRISN